MGVTAILDEFVKTNPASEFLFLRHMGPDWLLVLVRLLLFVKSKWEAQITIHQLQLDAAIRKQHVNDG